MKLNNEKNWTLQGKTGSVTRFLSKATRFLLIILVLCIIYGSFTQKQIADNLVRLHIVANSDSADDQAVKLKVRDAVLEHMQAKYPNGASRDEAVSYIKSSLPEIEKLATDVLKDNGFNEPVQASFGVYPFPTKSYDNLMLPAGMYDAVRIEIGAAEGKNWWCVMFPPLCISDGSAIGMSPSSQAQLKDSIGASNFKLITDVTESGHIPVKVKFRLIELVESSRIKLAELIGGLF